MGTFTRGGVIYRDNGDGTATVVGYEAAQPAGGVDPAQQYEAPKAAADAAKAQADASVATTTTDAQIRLANAQAARAQAEAAKATAEAATGVTSPGRKAADEAYAKDYTAWAAGGGLAGLETRLKVLSEALDVLESSDTITGPFFGRLPKAIQQAVNPQSQDVRADVERAIQESLRQTLGAQFTQKEGESLLARTFDPTQQESSNARRLKNLIDDMRAQGRAKDSAARYFEENGTISGWTAPRNTPLPNALTQPRLVAGQGPQAAAAGATTTIDQIPPEMQQEHAAFLQQWMGDPDPQAYARFRTELDRKYGYVGDPNEYLTGAQRMIEGMKSGATIDANIPGTERQMSGGEQYRNDILNRPEGAFVSGLADMGSLGLVSRLAPQQMQALGEAQPVGMTAGQVAGAITGTAGIGALGRAAAGRFAPNLLGGAGKAQFGRNVATDVAYSGAYGAGSGEGAGRDAALGGAGSVAGQLVGGTLGKVVGGLGRTPAAEYLKSRGIPLTIGQQLGGTAKGVEDAMTSVPFIGDLVNNRRLEGLRAFNRAAFDEAGQPINARVQGIGEEGVASLIDQAGNAYDSATQGVNVPLDGRFARDILRMERAGQMLPDDRYADFSRVMDTRIAPIMDAGNMTGEQYQSAFRALKKKRSTASQAMPGWEEEYRGALTHGMDALTGAMERGGGEGVVSGLRNADAAYRNAMALKKALPGSAGGSMSGEPFVLTPNQLQRSGMHSAAKYPGPRPFAELADTGQQVLPNKIPDSGTPRRLATMLLPGAIGGGAGLGALAGGEEGAATGGMTAAAMATLLALGGTKVGQKALQKALLDRPDVVKRMGLTLPRAGGLFGAPLALTYGN